jgi:hypothetical protein
MSKKTCMEFIDEVAARNRQTITGLEIPMWAHVDGWESGYLPPGLMLSNRSVLVWSISNDVDHRTGSNGSELHSRGDRLQMEMGTNFGTS